MAEPGIPSTPVTIKVRDRGPLKVSGPVQIVDHEGEVIASVDVGSDIVLCRCGASATKPICDGSHRRADWS